MTHKSINNQRLQLSLVLHFWCVSELLLQTVLVEVVCLVSLHYCCCCCCYCSLPSSLRHRPGVRPTTSPLMSPPVVVATAQAVACIRKTKQKCISFILDHWKQAETILTTNQGHSHHSTPTLICLAQYCMRSY